MSVKTVRPAGNLGTSQTDRNFSAGIWHDCPYFAIRDGEIPGTVWEFDFNSMPATPPTTEGNFGDFSVFTDTGGFINPQTGGGWVMGSDGDNEGAFIRTRATPFRISRTRKKLWFEARVKASAITDAKNNIFLGMIENVALSAVIPITAAGALADKNLVGFQRPESARTVAGTGGAIFNTVYKADGVTAVTVGTDAVTIAADTYVKLGFIFEPGVDSTIADVSRTGLGVYNLSFYANGLRLSAYKQIPSALGTDFPNDIDMSFCFGVLNATATTPGDATIDKARIVQMF